MSAVPLASHVRVDIPIHHGREDSLEPIRHALQAIAPFIAEGTAQRQDAVFRGVVDKIIEATPIRPLDAARAALEQRAIAALFSGTEWLTAEQVGRLRDPGARNPHGTANRWRAEGKVYALTKGGMLYYPRYAFDETLDPRPVVAEVMAVLAAGAGGTSPYRLASWFESTNSALDGRRPRELLASDPAAVLAAARAHAAGPVHG